MKLIESSHRWIGLNMTCSDTQSQIKPEQKTSNLKDTIVARGYLQDLPSRFLIKYNTNPWSRFFTKSCCGCYYRIIRRIENICRLEEAIEKKMHGSDCTVTLLSVTMAGSLGERCHTLGKLCHVLSEPGSLPRSLLRTTNGFGFRSGACVVDFNVKWRR